MWQWFLAGALVLLNIATILIVVLVVRLHARGAGSRDRAGLDGTEAEQLASVREDIAELVRQLDRLGEGMDARVGRRAEELRALLAEADERIAALQHLARQMPGGVGAAPQPDPRRAEVLRLAEQGIDLVEIARRTGMDVGAVELVLNLQRSTPLRQT